MAKDKKRIKKSLKEIFKEEDGVLFCYLFGSQVSRKVNSQSDIDVGVYLKDDLEDFFKKRLGLINKLSKFFKKQVDVIVLNKAYPFLKYVITKEGELVFSKNESKRVDFELRAINEYFDFKPILKLYEKELLKH